jgi:hypothetical protein
MLGKSWRGSSELQGVSASVGASASASVGVFTAKTRRRKVAQRKEK